MQDIPRNWIHCVIGAANVCMQADAPQFSSVYIISKEGAKPSLLIMYNAFSYLPSANFFACSSMSSVSSK